MFILPPLTGTIVASFASTGRKVNDICLPEYVIPICVRVACPGRVACHSTAPCGTRIFISGALPSSSHACSLAPSLYGLTEINRAWRCRTGHRLVMNILLSGYRSAGPLRRHVRPRALPGMQRRTCFGGRGTRSVGGFAPRRLPCDFARQRPTLPRRLPRAGRSRPQREIFAVGAPPPAAVPKPFARAPPSASEPVALGLLPSCARRAAKAFADTASVTRLHCRSRKRSGTRAAPSGVSSLITGSRKGWSSAMRCVRSTASFHSSRK
jgi:hypothetical protein